MKTIFKCFLLIPLLVTLHSCTDERDMIDVDTLVAETSEDPDQLSDKSGGMENFSHGNFTTSATIFRVPYADGIDVLCRQDHHTHSPVNRIDMTAGFDVEIVAAASGWIRAIVDHNGDSFGRGDGLAHDGSTPQDDSLEHSCGNNNPDPNADPPEPPNPILGSCSQYNNYVWIEHPNGEWTKYTHLGTGTVTIDYGWQVGDWIESGEVIGLESDIGQATRQPTAEHLHFEVAVSLDPGTTLTWSQKGGFIDTDLAMNRAPNTCDGSGGIFLYERLNTYTAGSCDNQPPVADAGGPYTVPEGSPLVLEGSGSLDPEGFPLTYRWRPAGLEDSQPNPDPSDPWSLNDYSLQDPTFYAGNDMVVDLTLFVYDQVEMIRDSHNTQVTVENVAPTVTINPVQTTVIQEGGTVMVQAEFTDPGWLDTHTASIDWGVPVGHEGMVISNPSIQILDEGGPGELRRGRVTASYRYGDNDAGNGFTIEVTVTDSDGAQGSASFGLTVENVNPQPSIGLGNTVLINGIPTVVASIGESLEFNGQANDPGSDDLTLIWDWADGNSDELFSQVNPPANDPLPSPTVQTREVHFPISHIFEQACLYEVGLSATDDDQGTGMTSVDVLIVGDADQARGAGYWASEYRMTKNPDFTPSSLECYLAIVNHMSTVFSEHRMLASIQDAEDILRVNGQKTADEIFDRQLLALWLNFANGAYGLNQLVDTTGDKISDTSFFGFLIEAEFLRTNPARTDQQVLEMKDRLEVLNTLDD